MSYVYKYVDSPADSVLYVGKVSDNDFMSLVRRHTAHKRDKWYNDGLSLYYLCFDSPADADIYETFFISKYGANNKLYNKAKRWGNSTAVLNESNLNWEIYRPLSAIKKGRPKNKKAECAGLCYKIDVLQALKDNGYNTSKLRKEKLLSESTIQKLRENKPIGWVNIDTLCRLLGCQPGDLLERVADDE